MGARSAATITALPPTLSDLGLLGALESQEQMLARVLAVRPAPRAENFSSLGNLFSGGLLGESPPFGATLVPPPAPRFVEKQVTRDEPDGHTVKLVVAYRSFRLPLSVLS
jgi:hypothetical protein